MSAAPKWRGSSSPEVAFPGAVAAAQKRAQMAEAKVDPVSDEPETEVEPNLDEALDVHGYPPDPDIVDL